MKRSSSSSAATATTGCPEHGKPRTAGLSTQPNLADIVKLPIQLIKTIIRSRSIRRFFLDGDGVDPRLKRIFSYSVECHNPFMLRGCLSTNGLWNRLLPGTVRFVGRLESRARRKRALGEFGIQPTR